jgi:hypothetical protein
VVIFQFFVSAGYAASTNKFDILKVHGLYIKFTTTVVTIFLPNFYLFIVHITEHHGGVAATPASYSGGPGFNLGLPFSK